LQVDANYGPGLIISGDGTQIGHVRAIANNKYKLHEKPGRGAEADVLLVSASRVNIGILEGWLWPGRTGVATTATSEGIQFNSVDLEGQTRFQVYNQRGATWFESHYPGEPIPTEDVFTCEGIWNSAPATTIRGNFRRFNNAVTLSRWGTNQNGGVVDVTVRECNIGVTGRVNTGNRVQVTGEVATVGTLENLVPVTGGTGNDIQTWEY